MKQEALSFFQDTHLTLIAFIIFILLFIGIVAWVFRRSASEKYDRLKKLPLEEDQENEQDK